MDSTKNQRNLYCLGKNKDIIIKTLSSDEFVTSLILPNYNINIAPDDLDYILKKHLYNTITIPEFQTEEKTYICVESYVASVDSSSIKEVGIIINVFCHNNLIPLSSKEQAKYINEGYFGNRVDCLIDAIDRCLNGKRDMGIGRLKLKPNRPVGIIQPSEGYYGKSLEYIVSDFNTAAKL